MIKDYKYDVAFSLCNQDAEFAKKIITLLSRNSGDERSVATSA